MSGPPSGKGRLLSWVVVLALLGASALTTLLLYALGDWERHGWALRLTRRIIWGAWVLVCLAFVLTRVTIFGWSFRKYFLREPEGPSGEPVVVTGTGRPVRAPWYKSGVASFSITVVLVSLTGTAALGTLVLWVLKDVLGDWAFWLVFKIVWGTWWVLCIVFVLTRVAIFGKHRKQVIRGQRPPPGRAAGGDGR